MDSHSGRADSAIPLMLPDSRRDLSAQKNSPSPFHGRLSQAVRSRRPLIEGRGSRKPRSLWHAKQESHDHPERKLQAHNQLGCPKEKVSRRGRVRDQRQSRTCLQAASDNRLHQRLQGRALTSQLQLPDDCEQLITLPADRL